MTFTQLKSSGLLSVLFYFLFLTNSTDGLLGDWCESAADCDHWLLQCQNFECTCWPPYIPDTKNEKCSIGIGGKCEKFDDICYDINASCKNTAGGSDTASPIYCVCNDGFLPHPETGICRPSLGSNCTSDGISCLAGDCIDGTCQCGQGLVPSQNNDRCGVAIGESCANNAICADPTSHCSVTTNICECDEGYQSVVDSNPAICKLVLGASCNETNECAPLYTTCEILRYGNSACTCKNGYVPSLTRTSCLPVTDHWPGTCNENLQCSAMFGRYSVCQDDKCACSMRYVYDPEDFGCVPIIHTAAVEAIRASSYESIKLLARTLSPHLPIEAKLLIDEILN